MATQLYRAAITLPNGKRKWLSSPTKEGLDKKKKEADLQVKNTSKYLCNSTFGEYAEIWFRLYKEPYLRDNSRFALRNALNTHIYPYLKEIPLNEVTPFQIQKVLSSLAGNSKSLNNKVVQALRGIFNTAIDNNLIEKSPVPISLRSTGKPAKESVPLTKEQSTRLLSATKDTRAYLFCLIALQTGMRRGEICGLMWDDVDFDNQTIHVNHNAILSDSETTVSTALKTSAAVRDIPIPPMLQKALQEAQNDKKGAFVLHMDNGKPLSLSSFSNLWAMVSRRTVNDPSKLGTKATNSKLVRTLDFHVTPHLLRHTYITRLFESGLDIKEVQYLAGHSTVDMTLRVYTHYQHESRKEETAKKIFDAFG